MSIALSFNCIESIDSSGPLPFPALFAGGEAFKEAVGAVATIELAGATGLPGAAGLAATAGLDNPTGFVNT